MIYFHSRRSISLSLFEESSKNATAEGTPVKRGRGRPPKLKAVVSEISDKNEFIPASVSSEIESHHDPIKEVENVVSLTSVDEEAIVDENESNSELNWDSAPEQAFETEEQTQQFAENYEEEYVEEEEHHSSEVRDFSQNNVALSFSWSLMNQLRQMSKMEGIAVEDLLVELVAEGVAKRVFEDQMRPAPSHLMTRTGYVHSDGTQAAPQPHLSHHMMNNNRQQPNNLQNRNRFGFQQRNNTTQHPQQMMNRNSVNNRNYQQHNSNNPRQTNNNNNQNGFRNQYNNNVNNNNNNNNNNNTQQQRFNSRPNYQNSQRFYEDQSSNSQQTGNNYRQQRDTNKR
ncbi:hypothetical protein [Silvanigrella aquatica]|uniref:Uncharacterized protein n=1 Tax=Silvanigrella aquatica TaxID=1915309 RepID=A0A1L4CX08_9BACT|nr:hypothetical protein [Silvanigrella aquatica]APJ02484.1 hypothetical protein AXG55_00455 [Silvanigrella aquatica]